MKRAIAIVLLLLALFSGRAEAHANLVRSDPPVGAVLQTAPRDLVLEFSEALDPSFSRVQLINSKNALINAGPGVIDPASPKVLRLPLAALPHDIYTAQWRSRSAVDGHVGEGSVPFGVGVALVAPLIPPLGTSDPALQLPAVSESAARWLNLLVLAVMLGGLPFGLFVLRAGGQVSGVGGRGSGASTQHPAPSTQAVEKAPQSSIRRLILGGAAVFVLTNGALLIVQAAEAAGVPLVQAIGAPVVQVLRGRDGLLLLARLVLLLGLVAVAWRLPPVEQAARRWWLALALGAGLILTFSLASHAATLENPALAIALDWLHLAAMVVWLGGLIPLLLMVRETMRAKHQEPQTKQSTRQPVFGFRFSIFGALIPRFSRVSLICIATLTLSGLYSYVEQIGALALLPATTYGQALLVKLGLFGVLLLLGAFNLLVLSRRLVNIDHRVVRAFGRTIRAEIVVGALLLLAVGALTSVAPSKAAWEVHQQQGAMQTATVSDVDLTLRVAPARVGDNQFAVDVRDRRPGAQQAASKVLLRFDMLGMPVTPIQVDTATSDTQRYAARGSFLSMIGRWHVEIVLRRAGFDDIRHTFELDVGS